MDIRPAITQDFLQLEPGTTVTQLIGKLRNYEKRAGLLFKNKKYLGLIDKKKLLRAKTDSSNAKVEKYVQHTPIFSEQTLLTEAIYQMGQGDLEFAPVEKDKRVIGVVHALDLLSLCKELPEITKKKVKDVKILRVPGIDKTEPLAAATRIMHEDHLDHIPIMEKNKLYGILSSTDLLRKYINWSPRRDFSAKFNKLIRTKGARVDYEPFSNLPVENFSMNYNLVTIQENQSLLTAIDQLTQHRVRDLLVLKGEKYQGLLTIQNILLFITSLQKQSRYTVEIKGIHKIPLTEHQENQLQLITQREAEKLQRKIGEEFTVTVHLKEMRKQGKQHVFAVALRIAYPGRLLTSEKEDWDLEKALHKCFNVVAKEMKG